MPSACTQCSGPHTSAQCPLDLSTIYKSIIDSIHHDNPIPNSDKPSNDYAWSDDLEAQLKRNIKPPTLEELTKWFEEPILADHFIEEYNGVWDAKTREDLIRFKEVNRNLREIQWQIEHLEALRTKGNEKAARIAEELSWIGFSGRNYEVVKELRKVDSKLSLSDPLPDASSSARFTPYNKRPTLAQRLSSPPRGSPSNPILIDIFSVKKPRGFRQAMEAIREDTRTVIPQQKKPPRTNPKAVRFSSTHSTIPTTSTAPHSTSSTPRPDPRSISQQKGKAPRLSSAELTRRGLCFKCTRAGHGYVNCAAYTCKHCRQPAPGHRADDCPILQDTSETASNDWDNHKDYSGWDAEYDDDIFGDDGYANITGEPI